MNSRDPLNIVYFWALVYSTAQKNMNKNKFACKTTVLKHKNYMMAYFFNNGVFRNFLDFLYSTSCSQTKTFYDDCKLKCLNRKNYVDFNGTVQFLEPETSMKQTFLAVLS